MPRIFLIALLSLLAAYPARADTDPDLLRWDQPEGIVVSEDDPAAPFVSFFTPIYRDEDQVATWSMMATRWRSNGRIDLSIGVRLVHADEAPWGVAAAKLEDGQDLQVDLLNAVKTCSADDVCVQRETATINLPLAVLERGAAEGMEIRLKTLNGVDRVIAFPRDILDQLYRTTGAGLLR